LKKCIDRVSSLSHKNILFIVEGGKTEPSLLRRLNKIIGFENYKIFSYNTCIYELFHELNKDDDLDLILTLKESAQSTSEKQILSQKYVSIYLIFDFDPHYQKYSKSTLKDMIEYFNNSYDRGKLYINYPMMESFRHLTTMPDHDFLHRKVSMEGLTKYKETVGHESSYTEMNKYNYPIVTQIIAHHLIKYHYLTKAKPFSPTLNEFENFNATTDKKLLDIQDHQVQNGWISIINTSVFYIVDLKPKSFFGAQLTNFEL